MLTFIRGMPNNTELSNRNINLKLAILLFLTSAGRCHEICYLNIKFMVRTKFFQVLFLPRLQKLEERETSTMKFQNILMMKNCVQCFVLMNTLEDMSLDIPKVKINFF